MDFTRSYVTPQPLFIGPSPSMPVWHRRPRRWIFRSPKCLARLPAFEHARFWFQVSAITCDSGDSGDRTALRALSLPLHPKV